MKFTSYQNRAQLGEPNSGVSNFHYSNPGAIAEAKEAGNLGVTIAKGALGFIDQVNNAKALEANNYYNQRMSEETADIINNHKEGNALDVMSMYDDRQQKVMDDTQKRFGKYIKFGPAAQAFHEYAMRDNATRRGNMEKYRAAEMEKYQQTVFDNGVQSCMQAALDGGYSDEAIDGALNKAGALTTMRFAAYGGDRIDAEAQKQRSNILAGAFDAALKAGESSRLIELDHKYGSMVAPDLRQKMRNAAQEGLKMQQDIKDFKAAPHFKSIEEAAQYFANMRKGIQSEVGGDGKLKTLPQAQFDLPVQDGIQEQIDNLKPELKGALPTIGGILNNLGVADGAEISSAARSYEHQMEVNPDAPNSYHVSSDAVDIVLPDDISGEQAEAVRRFFEESGAFEEVLYHDAGSGYHLHLGGYNGGLNAAAAEPGKEQQVQAPVNAEVTLEDRKKAEDYFKFTGQQEAIHRQAMGRVLSSAETKLKQLSMAGDGIVSQEDAYGSIRPMLTGDEEIDTNLFWLAKSYADKGERISRGGRGRGGRGGGDYEEEGGESVGGYTRSRSRSSGSRSSSDSYTPAGYKHDIAVALKESDLSPAEARAKAKEDYDNGFISKKMYEQSIDVIEDMTARKGFFALPDISNVEADIKKEFPWMPKTEIKAAEELAGKQNDAFRQEHGHDMTALQITDQIRENLTNSSYSINQKSSGWSFWGKKAEAGLTPAQLQMRGIDSVDEAGDGMYIIHADDGAYTATEEQMQAIEEYNGYWRDVF